MCTTNKRPCDYNDDCEPPSGQRKTSSKLTKLPQLQAYLNEIFEAHPILPDEELDKLLLLAEKGDIIARNKIVESSLRLVLFVISRYFQSFISSNDIDDLIQEGNIGLINAVSNWRKSNLKFTTYACARIRYHIIRALYSKCSLIRMPEESARFDNKRRKFEEHYYMAHGQEPSDYEIAEAFGYRVAQIEFKRKKWIVSLDELLEEKTSKYGLETLYTIKKYDCLIDDEAYFEDDVVDAVVAEEFREQMKMIIAPRYYNMISSYYGLEGKVALSAERIAEEEGVTKSRFWQIHNKCVEKMRNTPRIRKNFYNACH